MTEPTLTGRDKRLAVWSYNALSGKLRFAQSFADSVIAHPLTTTEARHQATELQKHLARMAVALRVRRDQL